MKNIFSSFFIDFLSAQFSRLFAKPIKFSSLTMIRVRVEISVNLFELRLIAANRLTNYRESMEIDV